jgi:predicted amidohydrolase
VSSSRASAAYLAKYQDLAKELNINIVPGTICEVYDLPAETNGATNGHGSSPAPKVEMRNMAYFVSAGTGAIAGSYQKKNLWHPERPHLTSSGFDPHVAFDTPLKHADGRPVRAGMLVCWDLAFPEAFRALITDGADLILIPSFWHLSDVDARALKLNPLCEKTFLEATLVSRAYENTCAVVYVNSGGLSQVAMPILGALGEIDVDVEEMKIVELDLDILALAEENYKVRTDLQREGWHYGYTLLREEKGEGTRED